MTPEELAKFDEASNHAYGCKCELCMEWWKKCGPEMEDDETPAGFGPFGDDIEEDDSDYCECGAVHGEEELGGICAACGKLTD